MSLDGEGPLDQGVALISGRVRSATRTLALPDNASARHRGRDPLRDTHRLMRL
jgi:hypothetical protein